MGNLKRDYLNVEEKNFYMVTKAYIQMIQGERMLDNKSIGVDIWDDWNNRGMITPSMKKSLKMAHTYLKKFVYELEDNLSDIQNEKLNKSIKKFDYKIIDDYTLSKLMRNLEDHVKYAVFERDKLDPILQDIAAVRCVGCTCDYKKCPLFKALDDIETPYVREESNCPYAANLDTFSEKDLNNIQQMKAIVNGRHSLTASFKRKVEYDDTNANLVEQSIRNYGSSNEKHSSKNKQRTNRKGNKKNRK